MQSLDNVLTAATGLTLIHQLIIFWFIKASLFEQIRQLHHRHMGCYITHHRPAFLQAIRCNNI